jgi:hypothetical protein
LKSIKRITIHIQSYFKILIVALICGLAFSSCNPDVEGCMDLKAVNFDPEATINDGSCYYTVTPIYGCNNPKADNYDPNANTNDGSCIFRGCTDTRAMNYDPFANQNDGSCVFAGCTDTAAWNHSAIATVDDGSCDYDYRNLIAGGYTTTNCKVNFTNSLFGDIEIDPASTNIVWFRPFFLDLTDRYALVNATTVTFPAQTFGVGGFGSMTGACVITSDSTMDCTFTYDDGLFINDQCSITYRF